MEDKYTIGTVADIIFESKKTKGKKRKSSYSQNDSHSPKREQETLPQEEQDGEESAVPSAPDVSLSSNAKNALKRIKKKKVRKPFYNGEKERRTVFVGNLPVTVKKMKIKRWFSKFGNVETVRLRCVPLSDPRIPKRVAIIKHKWHPKRTSIHAFVRFETEESALKAVEANGYLFDENHHIRVDLAQNEGNYNQQKAVFIGNLPFGVEEEQLRNIFNVCGEIENIRIIRDHRTGIGKGFGYVNFKEADALQLALKLDGENIEGRELRVKKSSLKMCQTKTKTYETGLRVKKNKTKVKLSEKKNSFMSTTKFHCQSVPFPGKKNRQKKREKKKP